MQVGAVGSKVAPQKFACGGWTGCERDHDFYDPKDVMLLHLAMPLEVFRTEEHEYTPEREAEAVKDGLLYVSDKAVIPTILGMWYEDASSN